MGLGHINKANTSSKRRAESVSIDKAIDLIEKLKLTQKEYAETFCDIGEDQFCRWKKRGYMPAAHYWASQNELAKYFKKQYDNKCKIIWGDNENTST